MRQPRSLCKALPLRLWLMGRLCVAPPPLAMPPRLWPTVQPKMLGPLGDPPSLLSPRSSGSLRDQIENFAKAILERGTPSREDVQQLFELLPKEAPPRGQSDDASHSFSCGAYSQGPLMGLRSATTRFPKACRVLTSFVSSACPAHMFTTLSVYRNVRADMHRDKGNLPSLNLVIPVLPSRGERSG